MSAPQPRRPGTAMRLLLFVVAAGGGALLLALAFPPGARDRLPVLVISLALALTAARRPQGAILAFSFLFPCAGLLARLFGGTEPLAWPLLLFAGLAAGWSFRFIYDFENAPDPSRWDPWLRAQVAIWVLAAGVALSRAHTLWALGKGLTGRAVNVAGLEEAAAIRESLFALAVLVSGAAFFFLLRRAGGAVRRSAVMAALAGIAVSALAASLQRVGVLPPEVKRFWRLTERLSGGAMDPNSLGLLCAMGVTVVAALLVFEARLRPFRIGSLLLLLAGLLLSGSRSGLLVPLVGLPAVFLARRRAWRAAAALAVGAAALVVLLLWVTPRPGTVAGRLAQTFDPRLPLQYRVSERPLLWRSAARLFERSPLSGGGLGAFSWSLPDLLREENRQLPMIDNPGSAYVQALAETGLIGFALTVVLAVSFARQALSTASDPGSGPLAVGAAAASLGFLVAQLLGSHWLAPDVCLFFFALASLAVLPAVSRHSRVTRGLLAAAVLVYAAASLAAAAQTATPAATFRHGRLAGFHTLERAPGGQYRWTRKTFGFWLAPGESLPVRLAHFPPDDREVVIESLPGEGGPWRRTLKPGESVLLRISGAPSSPRPVLFRLSRSFVPKRVGVSGDRRELGVQAVLPE